VCANARMSVQGAPGCARGLEEDVVVQEQELARRRHAWRHGKAQVAAGTACRAWKKAVEWTKAVVGRGATRGVAGKQEVALGCSDGKQRRGAARADGQAVWHGGERPTRLGEAVALG
jgi:hypothetical protein